MNIVDKLKLLYLLNKLYKEVKAMKAVTNWKTTLGAFVATLGAILKLFGIEVPEEVTTGLVAVGVFIIGFFSKDSNVTGGEVKNK